MNTLFNFLFGSPERKVIVAVVVIMGVVYLIPSISNYKVAVNENYAAGTASPCSGLKQWVSPKCSANPSCQWDTSANQCVEKGGGSNNTILLSRLSKIVFKGRILQDSQCKTISYSNIPVDWGTGTFTGELWGAPYPAGGFFGYFGMNLNAGTVYLKGFEKSDNLYGKVGIAFPFGLTDTFLRYFPLLPEATYTQTGLDFSGKAPSSDIPQSGWGYQSIKFSPMKIATGEQGTWIGRGIAVPRNVVVVGNDESPSHPSCQGHWIIDSVDPVSR